jgi:hypothetical protein
MSTEPTESPASSYTRSVLRVGWLVLVTLVLLTMTGCAAYVSSTPAQPDPALVAALEASICTAPTRDVVWPSTPDRVVSATDSASLLEDRYGIRITLLGVTAGGGILDFRYKVLDADKATAWLKNEALMPMLINENSHAEVMHAAGMGHAPRLVAGKVYYMLIGNSGRAIGPGDPVAVVIGNLRVGPIAAQ